MIVPMLVCADAGKEIDFCKAAFEATELSRREAPYGIVLHATLKIDQQLLMVHGVVPQLPSEAPAADGSSPVVIYLYGGDVDSRIERAVAAGARILLPAADQPWGDRVGRIIDPAGHVWNIASNAWTNPARKYP